MFDCFRIFTRLALCPSVESLMRIASAHTQNVTHDLVTDAGNHVRYIVLTMVHVCVTLLYAWPVIAAGTCLLHAPEIEMYVWQR